MTSFIRLCPQNQSQPCTPDWQLQGSTGERDRPFCRHEGEVIVCVGYLYQHQPCRSLWPFPWPFCRGHDFLPAVLELHRLLLMLLTFEEVFVTELILASAVHDPLHSWRTGLYLVARFDTVNSDSVHTEISSRSKSVLVQLCEQVQSVRHVCCVLCKSVFGQMPAEQLSSYSTLQTPDGLYKHCTHAQSLTWLHFSVGQPASFRSAGLLSHWINSL